MSFVAWTLLCAQAQQSTVRFERWRDQRFGFRMDNPGYVINEGAPLLDRHLVAVGPHGPLTSAQFAAHLGDQLRADQLLRLERNRKRYTNAAWISLAATVGFYLAADQAADPDTSLQLLGTGAVFNLTGLGFGIGALVSAVKENQTGRISYQAAWNATQVPAPTAGYIETAQ